MKTIKDIPVWAKILVWTPLGLIIYPTYYWKKDVSSLFSISNGILMGFYFVHIIDLIIKLLN